MTREETPLEVVVKGAIAGLAGTAALTIAMKNAPVLMQRLGIDSHGSSAARGGEGAGDAAASGTEAEEPTERFAEKVATGVFRQPIDEETKQVAAQAVHWGYGAAWGAFYGIMQSSLRLPSLLHGTLFGGLVGLVAATLVPVIGLAPSPTEQPMAKNAMQVAMHLLYGWVTAFAFHVFSQEG